MIIFHLFLTWIRKSEPFRLFQHRDSSISPRHVLGDLWIVWKTSGHSDDGTNYP